MVIRAYESYLLISYKISKSCVLKTAIVCLFSFELDYSHFYKLFSVIVSFLTKVKHDHMKKRMFESWPKFDPETTRRNQPPISGDAPFTFLS